MLHIVKEPFRPVPDHVLRAMFAAIKAGEPLKAEQLAREETAQAAAEVMRLLAI